MPYIHRTEEKALIIGSGIGGLSSALILAKLGYQVTVLEKNNHPGGMLRSYVRKGVHCNVGLHYLGALDRGQVLRRCFDFLGIGDRIPLQRLGVDGPVDRYYFDEDTVGLSQFDMPCGLDAYEASLKDAFVSEHEQINGFMQLLRRSAQQLNSLDFLFKNQTSANLIEETEPMGKLFSRLGCSPGLTSVLSVPSVWIGVPPSDCPRFYHTMTLASYLLSSWRLASNGAHMADLLAERLSELGGIVLTGHTVKKIDTVKGRVTGITLEGGDRMETDCVIGAVHPKIILDLLGPEGVSRSYQRRIMGLTDTRGMFAVSALVPRTGHREIPHNVFSIRPDADGSVNDAVYLQLRPSERPEYLLLSLLTSGHDELWRPWRNTLSGHRGDDYVQAKLSMAHNLITSVEPITGPFNGLEILDAYTPLTIRDWVNSPNGSAYGVMRSCNQLLSAAFLNRTALKGLYLAGQSVMAPGVLGTILGSLATVKFIVGPERFNREVRL